MITAEFHPSQWLRILQFLRTCPGVYVGQEENCRRFLTGTLWIARTGAQWRALPTEYGQWNTVYKRFLRWCERAAPAVASGRGCMRPLSTILTWNTYCWTAP